MKTVIIGMSGGVDSSVAAYLLKQEGYKVIGITFKMLPEFNPTDALEVAKSLDIEFHVEDIEDDFKDTIINNFLDSYKNGLTPNPCVLCNRKIKFKYLNDMRIKYKADYIATGHYAKIIDNKIYKSEDLNKDQTYFLSNIPKEYIKYIKFPLEGITKDKVREIASKLNLSVANKKDSYDVCFINDKFKNFMYDNLGNKEGNIILIDNNKIIGKHRGLMYYTIGQRRGLNLGGNEDRLFVVKKDLVNNILYVSSGEDSKYLYSNKALVTNFNYLTELRPTECTGKFRYRQEEIKCKINYLDDSTIEVLYEKAKAVTPGQTCVLYLDDLCLGGGTIKEVY